MNLKSWFIPFFSLLLLFSENLLYAYYSILGVVVESGTLQKVFIPLALISYLILINDFAKGIIKGNSMKVIVVMLLIIVLYGTTSLFFLTMPSGYMSHLLRYGSMGIASGIIGIHLAHYPNASRIERLLPLFILFTGGIIGTYGMQAALIGEMVSRDDDVGMSYQRVSYLMAELFSFSAYFVFFSSIKGSLYHKILRWPMLGMMFFCAILCPMSGGRGAFLLLLVSMFFLIGIKLRHNRKKLAKVLFSIVILGGILLFLSQSFNVMDSAGFNRISEKMMVDEGREQLYAKAYKSMANHIYMGSGIGSVWPEIGFYSHNVAIDLLVEVGVWGLAIMIVVVSFALNRLMRMSKNSCLTFFILIILLQSIVHMMFSAYWVSYYPFWFALAYSFSLYNRKNNINVR